MIMSFSAYEQLVQHLSDIHNLNMVYWLLYWDQNTHMPPGGATARAAQMATIKRIHHERLTSERTAQLIEAAKHDVNMDDFTSDEASMIRVAQRDYEYESALSSEFVGRYTQATAEGFEAWKRAKAAKDFKLFMPALARIVELKHEEAAIRGYIDHPYDVCMGAWERGLTTSQVRRIFDEQRPALMRLVANAPQYDDSVLHQPFDVDKQRDLAMFVSTAIGFDYQQWATFDTSPHPFCLQLAKNDIRLTTRFVADFFSPAFFGTLHESGHGLHGHGYATAIDGTFLSDMEKTSHAIAESQSRTWENLVGRSREFWDWLHPHLLKFFPEQFKDTDAQTVYQAVNRVHPQFIRIEADELTYNLHIMLRFDVEYALMDGQVRLEDLPDLWNDTVHQYFGIIPPDDAQGILQDVHWSAGGIGAFIGYALGNLLSVQYYNQALKAHPDIPAQIQRGQFDTLRQWLTDHIYTHGRKFTAEELTQLVTGGGISAQPYLAYLESKFGG
ncbi:MAG: carboxypeptidase [Phototrophicales bacterium]|nr:MAG: carboxypeptidase [Phototrophicales bacterium]RMG70061.1 MAG: carboxypeptidase M32 [Chloroflexota bacterium]